MSTRIEVQAKQEPSNFLVLKAKINAGIRVLRLVSLMFGLFALVGAAILTLILSAVFHLNPYMTMAGSLTGLVILGIRILPLKALWKSTLVSTYQEEHLYDLANKLAFEDIATEIEAILNDKPVAQSDHLNMKLCQARLLLIRQGQMRKSWKLAQYLNRALPDDPYQRSGLASSNSSLGYFEEAENLYLENIDSLSSESRELTPAAATSCIGLVCLYIDTHRPEDAFKWLNRLKELVEKNEKTTAESTTDRLVRLECNATEFDRAFYHFYSGKLKLLTGEPGALEQIKLAEKIMERKENQTRLQLFYPEIMTNKGRVALQENNCQKALVNFEEALKGYQVTPYRGPEYQVCLALIAYSKFKLNGTNSSISQIESSIRNMESQWLPNHPRLAEFYTMLGDCHLRYDTSKAREAYEKALAICQKAYRETDKQTLELATKLATLPVDNAEGALPEA